jgi:hypothetical protein
MPCSGRRPGRPRYPEHAQAERPNGASYERALAREIGRNVETDEEALHRTGALMLTLLPTERVGGAEQSWPNHEHVLRPLLGASEEVWAYAGEANSKAERAAAGLLKKEKGKYRIRVDGDPIGGREAFWNATGGERGSVVFTVRRAMFVAETLFRHCWGPGVLSNFTAAHTPAAVRYARSKVADGEYVVCMLSRNNGFQWLFVLATPPLLSELLGLAEQHCIPARLQANSANEV